MKWNVIKGKKINFFDFLECNTLFVDITWSPIIHAIYWPPIACAIFWPSITCPIYQPPITDHIYWLPITHAIFWPPFTHAIYWPPIIDHKYWTPNYWPLITDHPTLTTNTDHPLHKTKEKNTTIITLYYSLTDVAGRLVIKELRPQWMLNMLHRCPHPNCC